MKASTSRGGGRREVGGEGDKQRTDLAEKQLEVTDELKNYISAINAPPSNLSPRRRRQGRTAMNQLEKIRDQHLLHTFLQDCEDLHGKTEAPSLPV